MQDRPASTPQEQARSARWRLRAHQGLWLVLAVGLAVSALPFLDLPAGFPGAWAGFALVLSIGGALHARKLRTDLLAAVGPAPRGPAGSPPHPGVHTTWKSDPRTVIADSFTRTTIWWSCSASALALLLVAYLARQWR